MNKRDRKGFTLVELLAVISILAIIMILVVPSIGNLSNNSKESLKQSKINTVITAAQNYGTESINKYQKCFGATPEFLRTNCTVSISSLIANGYIDGEDDKNYLVNPVTNEELKGDVLLCYDAGNIAINASFIEDDSNDDNYSCASIAPNSSNSLNLSSGSGVYYIGGSSKEINIIKNGNYNGNLSCDPGERNSEGKSFVTCKIENNNTLVVTPIASYEGTFLGADENGNVPDHKEVTVTVKGIYGEGDTLEKSYTAKIYPTSLNVSAGANNACVESGKTYNYDVTGLNMGPISINGTGDGLSASYKNNILYVTAGEKTGLSTIELSESNGNNKLSLSQNVYKLNVSMNGEQLNNGDTISVVKGETVTITVDYAHTGNSDSVAHVEIPNTTNAIIASANSSQTNLREGTNTFTINGRSAGNIPLIISGTNCGRLEYNLSITNIKLQNKTGTLFVGGNDSTVAIETDTNNLTCKSSNESLATCMINGTSLVMSPTKSVGVNYRTQDVTITVFADGGASGSDTYTATVYKTTINAVNPNNENDTIKNVFVAKENAATATRVKFIGDNMGEISISNISDWYLAEADMQDDIAIISSRYITSTEETGNYKAGYNTGLTTVAIKESYGNQIANINYYIYTLDPYRINEQNNHVALDAYVSLKFEDTYRFFVETSGVPNLQVTSSNPGIVSVNNYDPTASMTVNEATTKEITLRANSTGDATITIKGTVDGETFGAKQFDVHVEGKDFVVYLERGTFTSRIGENSLSCQTTGNSQSCKVRFPSITPNSYTELKVQGWNTTKDSTGVSYESNSEYTINSSNSGTTFYGNSIDITAPSCQFTNVLNTVTVNSTSHLTLSCSDNGSGLKTNQTLKISDFTINNSNIAEITAVSSPVPLSNRKGYSYVIDVQGKSYGNFNIKLKDNAVSNPFNLNNRAVTTNDILSAEYSIVEKWNIGKNTRSDVVAVLYSNKEVKNTDDGTYTLKIYGSGDMLDFTQSYFTGGGTRYAPWYDDYRNLITDVSIANTVTNLGDYAFYQSSYLKNVILSTATTYIGESAFADTTKLDQINSGSLNALKEIRVKAFINSGITKFNLPNSVTSIGSSAFENSALTSIDIGLQSFLITIESNAFKNAESLTSIYIPYRVTSIGDYAFSGNTNLTTATFDIASTLNSLGVGAFEYCESLEEIIIPSNVAEIKDYTFRNSAFTNITIGFRTTNVKTSAFDDTFLLKTINIPAASTSYKSINGVLYTYDGTTLVKAPSNYQSSTISMPNTVTTIGKYAFTNTIDYIDDRTPVTIRLSNNLAELNLDTNFNVYQVSAFTISDEGVNYKTIDDILYSKDGTILYKVPPLYNGTDLSISSDVTELYNYSLFEVRKIEKVTIPDTVNKIGHYALYTYDLVNGIKEVILDMTYFEIGESALDIYDMYINGDSSVKKTIVVGNDEMKEELLKLDYIDDVHIEIGVKN